MADKNISLKRGSLVDGDVAGEEGSGRVQLKTTHEGYVHVPSVCIDGPTTAFGELRVAELTPQVQLKFPYDMVHSDVASSLTNKSGSSVSASGGQASVTAAGVANSFSQIRTKDTIRYGPGQGALFRGTALFTNGVANCIQLIGAGDDDEGYFFYFKELVFGVMRWYGGSLEFRSVEITGAATGTGNITITLDDTAVNVAVTSGDTIAQVTEKIVAEAQAFLDAGNGWEVHTDDNITVNFVSLRAENATGTFSFSGGSTGVTANAFSLDVTGVAPTEFWTPQTEWNVDKMDGTGPSKMTLDPIKGNVYAIPFQYLGYGEIGYYIENPATGAFQLVHREQYSNSNTLPSLKNPTLHCTAMVKTLTGYSGGAITLKTSSLAGFIEGKETEKGIRRSISSSKTIGTTENVLLILHNETIYNSIHNKISVYPDFTSFSSEATKPVELILYRNPTRIDGATALTDVDTGSSVMRHSSTGTTIAGGERLLTFELGKEGSGARDLSNLIEPLRPGDRWVITARVASGSAAIVKVSYTWIERI